jgi:hypothetical protein
MRQVRALSGWVVVAGASTCFGALAAIVTWIGASQRHGAWVAAVPQMYEEQVAYAERLRQRFPDMTSDLHLHTMLGSVPAPGQVLGALGSQVLVQTLFFTAVCALMVLLNLGGRPIWALLAPTALIAGVAVSAGPLAFLPGTLGAPLAPTPVPGLSYVYFAAPLWWRLTVAALAALPMAGAWLLTRRVQQQRQPVVLGKTVGAVALFGVVAEISFLVVPQTLVPESTVISETLPTAAALLVVGCCAAVAGSGGTMRRGVVAAVVAALAGGAAWLAAWVVYQSGDSPAIFGWEQASGQPSLWLGTWQLIALVLAAGGLGCAAGAATRVLTAHRPSGLTVFGRSESPSLPI